MNVVATDSDKQYRLARHYLGKLRSAQHLYQRGNENASYGLKLAQQDWPQIQHWQAWATSRAAQEREAAALCSAYSYEAGELLHLMLPLQEHRVWREAALVQAQRLDDSQAKLAHHLALGIVYERLSYETLAIEHALQALTLAEQLNDQSSIGQACLLLGDLALRQGNTVVAHTYIEQSLRCFRLLYRSRDIASALHSLADIAFVAHDLPLCRQCLTEALDLYQQAGDSRGITEILRSKRYWFDEPTQFIEQVDLEKQVQHYLQMGDRFAAAGTLMSLADNALSTGDFAASERYISERLELHRQLGMPRFIASGLDSLGVLCMIQERYASGRDYLLQGAAICRHYRLLATLSRALLLLALAYWGLDDPENLYAALQEGFPLTLAHEPTGVPLGIAAFAAYRLRTNQAEAAAVLIGVVDAYPGTEPDIRAFAVKRLRRELENMLDPEILIAAIGRGAKLDFDATVTEISTELSS